MKATVYPDFDIVTPRNRIRSAILHHFEETTQGKQSPAHAALVNEEIKALIEKASHSDDEYTEWNQALGLHVRITAS